MTLRQTYRSYRSSMDPLKAAFLGFEEWLYHIDRPWN